MPSFEEARFLILEHVSSLGTEVAKIEDSFGRILAEEIVAPWDLPAYDNSAMDGYVVHADDCQSPASLPIVGCLPAGAVPSEPLRKGSAIRIMTGAPIPIGGDAVVPLEEAVESDGHVLIDAPVRRYRHIRRAGEDVCSGERLLEPGVLIRPAEINMLACCGKHSAVVYRRPRVAILSIGDELVEAGHAPGYGRVVNSNGPSLAAAVAECGAIPLILGIAKDNHAEHREKILEGLQADALITSAGVSVGARDLVRAVLQDLGAQEIFVQVAMRPGSPTCFYRHNGKPIFCLPGNPVASLISFEGLVRPALRKMLGHRRVLRASVTAILQEEIRKKPGSLQFLRVRLAVENGKRVAYSAGKQNTGALKTLLCADGLALLPEEGVLFSPGDVVKVHLLSEQSDYLEFEETK